MFLWLAFLTLAACIAGALVSQAVFSQWWFAALLVLLGLNLAACSIQRYRVMPAATWITHLGMLTILSGGVVSAVSGVRGAMSLTEGSAASLINGPHGDVPLPFGVRLKKFTIEYYPSPKHGARRAPEIRQFSSRLEIVENGRVARDVVVCVNSPASWKGYRLYQSGYDPRRKDLSVLELSRDPGIPVVYAGFVLLPLGLALSLLRKRSKP